MDPVQTQKMLQEFAKETGKMEMTEEMMSDAVGDALDDDEIEGETDDLTSQILDEIGIDMEAQMAPAPKTKLATKARVEEAQSSNSGEIDELERRLAALKS
eukprot:TRINITY_DN1521_c0_g1_i1.p1 TRINITY_DN1521_c0_g1~~TRINITY_DN1521_c0_g1_i1.p1  ORF type:complete len:118 (+),score=40.92 TRINITY_DN1521_c0_g1_i1:53-355(+)